LDYGAARRCAVFNIVRQSSENANGPKVLVGLLFEAMKSRHNPDGGKLIHLSATQIV
jgi:hypothetical protein